MRGWDAMGKGGWGGIMMLSVLASVATADAQQTPDPRVADLVRMGRIRVAVFPPMYTKNSETGEIGGMQMDLSRALAKRLGVEALPVEYPTPAEVVEGLKAGTCEVAFLVV